MMITASAVTANPLREAALVGLAEKTPAAGFGHESTALAEINQTLRLASIGLQFEFANEAGKMIAKVADLESGELIRQIPSDEVVAILKALGKLQGLLMHQTILNKWLETRGKSKDLLLSEAV